MNISRLDPKIGILGVKSLKKIIFTNNIGFGIQREHEKKSYPLLKCPISVFIFLSSKETAFFHCGNVRYYLL